ncbi:hypothetical protein PRK78_001764 [Emydomyces testavorans]|uniref:Uncharacterized protein n=1 Tax=Emydomyces testavorans TaxID=2070801 RepID=A0AAF0IH67_9EURO|nr:hypothetical protein PRK78_001764 [Emydomyces testavorans]
MVKINLSDRRVKLLLEKTHRWGSRQVDILNAVYENNVPAESTIDPIYLPDEGHEVLDSFTTPQDDSLSLSLTGKILLESSLRNLQPSGKGTMRKCCQTTMDELMYSLMFTREQSIRHKQSAIQPQQNQMQSEECRRYTQMLYSRKTIAIAGGSILSETTPKQIHHENVLPSEVPLFLVQAILAFQQNPTLQSHRAFVVRMRGNTLQVATATISSSYLDDLYNGRRPVEELRIYQSEPCRLLETSEQRKAIRLLFGLIRYLDGNIAMVSGQNSMLEREAIAGEGRNEEENQSSATNGRITPESPTKTEKIAKWRAWALNQIKVESWTGTLVNSPS